MKFREGNKKQKPTKKIVFLIILLLIFMGMCLGFVARSRYMNNLKAVSQTSQSFVVNIAPGSTTSQVAILLEDKGIIKSAWAFEWYVRLHKDQSLIQSGQYTLNQNQGVSEIVKILNEGKVATDLVTILPARNIEQIKQGLVKAGYTSNNVDKALKTELYSAHPALLDLPSGATLEGYLYPETFQKTADTKLEDIVRLSLDEMANILTSEVKAGFKKQGLSVHQAIILASIVENESATAEDREKVASVFINRLKAGQQLQSNATDEYSKDNPAYDTYKIPGLPPGPISNVSETSIKAVAFPANTDFLFFVTADDLKTTYFSKTVEEHNALVRKHCKLNCAPH